MTDYIVKGNYLNGDYADGVRDVRNDLLDLLERFVDTGDVLKHFHEIADCVSFSKMELALLNDWLFLEEYNAQCDTKRNKITFECFSYNATRDAAVVTRGCIQCTKRTVTLKWQNFNHGSGYIEEENTLYFYPDKQ